MSLYQDRKSIALGLTPEPSGIVADIFTVSPASLHPQGLRPQVSATFYEKTLGIQPAQERHRVALEFMEEYESDQKAARKRFASLCRSLAGNDAEGLRQLFARHHAADWLSYVFLDDHDVEELITAIRNAPTECRDVIHHALEKELKRFVAFKELFNRILTIGEDKK
jgi:hypothetical protein